MKRMKNERLESEWMDEREREEKAGTNLLPPDVNLPFVKGISDNKRGWMRNILDRVRLVV